MSSTLEQCSNCELGIGKLETPYIWNGSIVCQSCHQRLSQLADLAPKPSPPPPPSPTPPTSPPRTAPTSSTSTIPYATPAHLATPAPLFHSGRSGPPSTHFYPGANGPSVICPNTQCGYTGPSMKKQNGSMLILILLILFWILPGIIYYALCMKTNLTCPRCGIKIRDA